MVSTQFVSLKWRAAAVAGIMAVNARGTFLGVKYGVAAMKAKGRATPAAASHAPWADLDVLRNTYDKNPALKDTQFADYHGHGWNFRAVFRRDREGNLLDADGAIVSPDDPEKFKKNGMADFVEPA